MQLPNYYGYQDDEDVRSHIQIHECNKCKGKGVYHVDVAGTLKPVKRSTRSGPGLGMKVILYYYPEHLG